MRSPPTEEHFLEMWRWWKALPPKKRPPLGRSEYHHERRRNTWTGCTRGYQVQIGQLIEAYGSAEAAARAVEERSLSGRDSAGGEWWETVYIILLRVTKQLK